MREGWEIITFGDIMTPAKIERCGDRTDLPILSITMRNGIIFQNERFKKVIASSNTKDYKIVNNGQLVIAFPVDEGLIYTQDIAEQGIMSPAYNIWDVDYSKHGRRFLGYYFHCPFAMNYYKSKLRGTTQRRRMLPKEVLLSFPIPVPPLSEQQRIVSELDLLSSIIEKKKAQLKEYDQLAQSIFYDMFGDPVTNEKGWEVKMIGETCNITCGQDCKAVVDEKGKYPIYGTGGIMGWANQFRCPRHSVIIGRKGNINNPILVDVDFWNVDTAFGITPHDEVLNVIYFFFFCKEYDFTQHDVSVTIPSLRRTDILKIKYPLPPLPLQQSFASKIEAIERQKALLQQSITEAETLFNSRMDFWFS